MAASSEMDAPARVCRPEIVAAGLPQRGELILQRERNLYAAMVAQLSGQRSERSFEEAAESLTMEDLEQSFAARKPVTLFAAAWLAGRCRPDAPEDRRQLQALPAELIDALAAGRQGALERAYIEAAMSLALLGAPEQARRALAPIVATGAPPSSAGYLAAFYLAQLGDPSGYPAMVAALRDESEHTRLMAMRHLIGFQPYDGQRVGGQTVDLRAELVARLKDPSPYVRVEAPYYLAEAGVADLEQLLTRVAKVDRHKDVRAAARETLSRL